MSLNDPPPLSNFRNVGTLNLRTEEGDTIILPDTFLGRRVAKLIEWAIQNDCLNTPCLEVSLAELYVDWRFRDRPKTSNSGFKNGSGLISGFGESAFSS
jgi:hypothetical protein